MAVRVSWVGSEPEDREQWEDLLRAEYGTAMGSVDLTLEKIGEGWQVLSAREDSAGAEPLRRLDVRQRFVSALRMGGKPVVGESENEGELEPVTADALMGRAEEQRRRGGADE